jgi:hypothetical protein
MPSSLWQDENVSGRPTVAALLGVPDLDTARVNMTSIAPNELLLRGFALNRSNVSGGSDGLESFLDVNMRCVCVLLSGG